MTRILGEYTTMTGDPRRLVAARRTGPVGWCLLDVPTRADAPADDFQIVRRLGDPSTFGLVAGHWIERATTSPLGERWLEWWIGSNQLGSPTIETTVDVYSDRLGMRRLVLVADPISSACSHLVDVSVDRGGAPARLIALDLKSLDQALDFAPVHVEAEALGCAATDARNA